MKRIGNISLPFATSASRRRLNCTCFPTDLTPYEFARRENDYPLERILETAELASSLAPGATSVNWWMTCHT